MIWYVAKDAGDPRAIKSVRAVYAFPQSMGWCIVSVACSIMGLHICNKPENQYQFKKN